MAKKSAYVDSTFASDRGSSTLQFKHVTNPTLAVSFTVKWSDLNCPYKHKELKKKNDEHIKTLLWQSEEVKSEVYSHLELCLILWEEERRGERQRDGSRANNVTQKEKNMDTEQEGEKRCMMKMLRIRHPPVCEIWRSRPPEWILVEFGGKRHRRCKTRCASWSGKSVNLWTVSIYINPRLIFICLRVSPSSPSIPDFGNLNIKSPWKSHGISHPIRAAG